MYIAFECMPNLDDPESQRRGVPTNQSLLALGRQGLRTLHRVSVKGAPAASLPRDNEEGWLAEHTRGYRTRLEPEEG